MAKGVAGIIGADLEFVCQQWDGMIPAFLANKFDLPATAMRFAGVSGCLATRDAAPVRVRRWGALASAFVTCSSPDFMTPADQACFADIRRRA